MQFKHELQKLNASLLLHEVRFLVIGGFAVNYHGYARATNDLDIWLQPTTENYLKFVEAIAALGYQVDELKTNILTQKKTFVRIPFEVINVEFLTNIPGDIPFAVAFNDADELQLGDQKVKVIGYKHLIENKEATNRPKDLQDVIELKRRKNPS